jgi:hypothetical protein
MNCWRGHCAAVLLVLLTAFPFGTPARADRISNPIALFSGLDKITAVATSFEAKIGEDVAYGKLVVRALACYTRPITEQPKTTAFVQISLVQPDQSKKQVFSGWMIAESPGLNALEDPVFDVWLTGCRDPNAPPPPVETAPVPPVETPPDPADESVPED